VIQFRPEPLDIGPFKVARKALGEAVPDIEELQDEGLASNGIWVYSMSCIPGQTWLNGARGKGSAARVTINKSLARILSKSYIDGSADQVVESQLKPRLNILLASAEPKIQPFHAAAKDMLQNIDQLKVLPLFLSHFDLNEVNILVDDECNVSGIVDWELASILPFGMGFCRIHTLAGEFSERKFHMPPEFEDSERGVWKEIFTGVPVNVRKVVEANLEVVNFSVKLGTLLNAFQLEDDGKSVGGINPVVVEALPKFLSYRIPQLRGSAPPYSK